MPDLMGGQAGAAMGAPASMMGISPDMLKQLMPHIMPFLAGAGLGQFVGSIDKLVKTMSGGGAHGKSGQQPTGQQASPAGAASGPQAAAPPNPQQLMMLMQLLKARGMA